MVINMRTLRRGFGFIDMRSDTVSLPTTEMRAAWMNESLHETRMEELETKAATLLGKEAAVWLPSGTMSNVIGLMSVSARGTQVVLGSKSHIYQYEQGGMSSLGGLLPAPITNQPDGSLSLEDIKAILKPEFVVFARISTIALENTQNVCSGKVLSSEYVNSIRDFCNERGFKLYLDGARLLNAYVALKQTNSRLKVPDVTKPYDAVNLCLSKGLSCPIGSVLASDAMTVAKARRYRDMLGGKISQPGALAVSGLVALDHFEDWLAVDHDNAKRLSERLRSFGYTVDPFDTNIMDVSLGSVSPALLSSELKLNGLLANPRFDCPRLRLVIHSGLSVEKIEAAGEVFRQVGSQLIA